MQLPVAAFDIGYGYTKIVFSSGKKDLRPKTLSFPSLSPTTLKKQTSTTALLTTDVKTIEINNTRYLAGPDVELHQKPHHTRVLSDNYVHTEQYLALNLAAMAYTGATHISTLVVGLPVDLFDSKQAFVKKLLTGEHTINDNKTVIIDNVFPVAQPVGGLYHATAKTKLGIHKDKEYLVIDPGYYTFDWFVIKGLKRNEHLSGHHPGGMSSVLASIADSIGHEYGVHYSDSQLGLIDTALQSNVLKIQDKSVSLTPHIKAGEADMMEAIQVMQNHIGDKKSFEHTFLVGGPAKHYLPVLNKQLPLRNITCIDNPMFANVNGFYGIGLDIHKNKERAAS